MDTTPRNQRERIAARGWCTRNRKLIQLGQVDEHRSANSSAAVLEQERKRIAARAKCTGSAKLAALAEPEEHRSIRYGEGRKLM